MKRTLVVAVTVAAACEEALAYGVSVDVFKKLARSVKAAADRTAQGGSR